MLDSALRCKDMGNALFKLKTYGQAVEYYEDGLGRISEMKRHNEESYKLHVTFHQNIAVCMNAAKEYYKAIEHCTKALKVND